MRIKKIVIIICCCFLTTGCWDRVEIDRKSFISTIGVDVGEDIDKEEEVKKLKPDEPFTDNNLKRINVTYSFPDISQLGPEKGGVAEEKSINTEAYSMEDSIAKATAKSSRAISFGHTKLLIISSDLFAYTQVIKEVMDYFQREASLNRNMLVVMADGDIEDFINYKPNMEKNIQSYIAGLIENKASGVIPVTLNDFLINLDENGNAILPWLVMEKDKNELKLSGTGVIKDFTFKDVLSSTETIDIQILRGDLKGGKKVTYKDGHPVDFQIEGIERKIKLNNSNGKLSFLIDLSIEGQIKGYYFDKNVFSKAVLDEIEKDLNKSLKEEMEQVIKTIQTKYAVDLIGIREYTQKYHPTVWKQVKNNWDEIYKNIIISVNVDTHIRRIGTVK
ncbi:Ger(x)C family spore germination protein [Clostridium rectalis]|uniref:Ger(x)C family spore germination protein n=1 Tax=Clostridium rectalis TaxID=2040295 RepID=UPI0013DE06B7|nr:Ger(x)C family spore germination protein [Clostridium rectalis]